MLLYENLYVLNILTKGTLRDTLANREWRLVLSLMIREGYKVRITVFCYSCGGVGVVGPVVVKLVGTTHPLVAAARTGGF